MEHPRVCGENCQVLFLWSVPHGTSPRMRGKRFPKNRSQFWTRNIPAYAGKTVNCDAEHNSRREHPRVCGENLYSVLPVRCKAGTSPRMRGKRGLVQPRLGAFRNIPAYAGKTTLRGSVHLTEEEHPRVCGENQIFSKRGMASLGTSPRMRGKHGGVFEPESGGGNIPAYAGKTANQPT